MIGKSGKGWKAFSSGGRPLSKQAKSKKAAIEQLYAVEMDKMRRGKQSRAAVKRAMTKLGKG